MISRFMKRAFIASVIGSGMIFSCSNGSFAQELPRNAESVEGVSVNTEATFLDSLYTRQWVAVNQNGQINGTTIALEPGTATGLRGVNVALLKDGQVVVQTTSRDDGSFSLAGVRPGLYAISATNGRHMSVYSLTVVDGQNAPELISDLEVRMMEPAQKAIEIIRRQSLPSMSPWTSTAKIMDPNASAKRFNDERAIRLGADGTVGGKVSSLYGGSVSNMMVFFVRNGVEVAKAQTDATGSFAVKLEPGVYGLVAASGSGVAVMGIEVVKDAPRGALTSQRLIAAPVQSNNAINIEIIPFSPSGSGQDQPELIVADNAVPPMGMGPGFGGPGGGSFGGGGGGGPAGGGLAGIAGIAGLATVAGIAAANNGNNAAIVSPIVR